MNYSQSFEKPYMKLLLVLLAVIVGFFVVSILSVLIIVPFYGFEALNLMQNLNSISPEMVNLMKIFQIIQAVGIFMFPAIIVGKMFYSNKSDRFGLQMNKSPLLISLLLAGLLIFISIPIINFLGDLNSQLVLPKALSGLELWMKASETNAMVITNLFLRTNSLSVLLFNIFVMAVMPAISEELFFRGLFQRIMIDWTKNIHWGIIISACFFSAFHMQFYGFVPRFALGILLGYIFVWSKSLWIPIFAHFTNNAVAVIMSFYLAKNQINTNKIDKFGTTQETIIYLIFSTILVSILIYYFYKIEMQRKAETLIQPEINSNQDIYFNQ